MTPSPNPARRLNDLNIWVGGGGSQSQIHKSVWSCCEQPTAITHITDYSVERSLRPMGIVVMQNRWAFISSECLREICRRSVFTASSADDNEPKTKRQRVRTSRDRKWRKWNQSVLWRICERFENSLARKCKKQAADEKGGWDGNELMTEIEREQERRRGDRHSLLPRAQAWSPATVPDGLTERGKEKCSCHS